MNQAHIKAILDGVVPELKTAIENATKPLAERIDALEKREPLKGDKGDPGQNGVDGKDGAPGIDGKDGAPGLDGKDGRDGTDGKDGEAGKDGIDGKDGAPGRDGNDGIDGKPGLDGKDGAPGRDGRDASDLAGIRSMIVDEISKTVQPALAELKVSTPDDGRTLVFEVAGVTHEIRTAAVLDRGVWREGEYHKGDGVTWGGSFLIAQRDTKAKPETAEAADDWRLAVKRGRDGKDFRPDKPRETRVKFA